MLKTLKTLCVLGGISGCEDEVSDYIVKRAKKYADELTIDPMGNIIVFKKGKVTPNEKIALCAHMDEIGLIVTSITDDGYLKVAKVGGIDNRVILGKAVLVGKNKIQGVIGCKAIHLVKPKDRERPMEADEMYVDIGAKDREEAVELVSLGDAIVFDEDVREFGDGFIKAKAIDDRFGCAILLELIESALPIDCTFVFSVQEEVGLRGAFTAAYKTAPDIAIIVEGTTAADLPSAPESKRVCKVGGGPVIPFMDGGTIYNKEVQKIVTDIAEKNNISWQTKTYISGGTDGAAFQRSRAGVKVVGIAAPIRNLHSPACVGKISDMEDVQKLIGLYLEELSK